MYPNQFLRSMYTLGGMPEYVNKYLDTMTSLYDYNPALRPGRDKYQRPEDVLEEAPPVPVEGKDWVEGEGGGPGGGTGEGWGDSKGIGTPSNTDLGIPTTIGPTQALGNVLGLLSNPIGLPVALAMQHKGINPMDALKGLNPFSDFTNAFSDFFGMDPYGYDFAQQAAQNAFGDFGTGVSAPESYGPGAVGGPVGGFGADYGDPMGGFGGLGIGNPESYGGASAGPGGAASGDPSGGLAGNDGLGDVW